jgi:hypothetical protein
MYLDGLDSTVVSGTATIHVKLVVCGVSAFHTRIDAN